MNWTNLNKLISLGPSFETFYNMRFFLLLFLSLTLSHSVQSLGKRILGKKTYQSKKLKLKQKRKKVKKWSVSGNYTLSLDDAEPVEPKLLTHLVSITPAYRINRRVTLSSPIRVFYQSLGREIIATKVEDATTFNLGALLRYQKPINKNHSYILNAFLSKPEGGLTRFEGHSFTGGAGFGHRSHFLSKRMILSTTLTGGAINNEFEFSPVSLQVNPNGYLEIAQSYSFKLSKYLTVAVSISGKGTRYYDNSLLYTYRNTLSLNTQLKPFSISAFYKNGDHQDRDDYPIWYYDQYRRLIGFSLSASY